MLIRTVMDPAAGDTRAWPSSLQHPSQRDRASSILRDAFWTRIWPHIKDDTIQVKVWFLKPSLKVAALQPLFERVFGPAPEYTST